MDEQIKKLRYIYTMEYYLAIKEWMWVSCSEVDEPRPIEWSKSEREKQASYVNAYIWKNGVDEPICREGMGRQMSRMDLWTQSGKKKVGRMEKVCAQSLQLCPTLCDPMDFSLPGSSVHGILQARILEWVAIPFSYGESSINIYTLPCAK